MSEQDIYAKWSKRYKDDVLQKRLQYESYILGYKTSMYDKLKFRLISIKDKVVNKIIFTYYYILLNCIKFLDQPE